MRLFVLRRTTPPDPPAPVLPTVDIEAIQVEFLDIAAELRRCAVDLAKLKAIYH